MFDPADQVTLEDSSVLRLGHEIQRVDDIVGVEVRAVVEFDALAQIELERLVVDPPPRRRELALELAGLGIAKDQRVPDCVCENVADCRTVEVRIDIRRRELRSNRTELSALPASAGVASRAAATSNAAANSPKDEAGAAHFQYIS